MDFIKKTIKIIIIMTLIITFFILCIFNIDNQKFGFLFQSLISNLIWTILFLLISSLYINWNNLIFYILNITVYKEKNIRISAAYLIKIKIEDEYLLIKGSNIEHQYQPIGGVYKIFSEGQVKLEELKIKEDKYKPDKSKLRKIIKGRYLNEFIKWFNSEKGREVSIQRKFYEELLKTNILNRNIFSYIDYRKLHTNNKRINFSQELQIEELLIHNIYELIPVIDSNQQIDQEKELKKLHEKFKNEKKELENIKILIEDYNNVKTDSIFKVIKEKISKNPEIQGLNQGGGTFDLEKVLEKIKEIEKNRKYIWVNEEALMTNGASDNINIANHSKYLLRDKK